MHELISHHAHLWIGDHDTLIAHALKSLQALWCSNKGCGQCSVCKRIVERQYHNLLWLRPEKQSYTVDQIDALHEHLALQRDIDEHFFVVFEAAHALSTASANKLLKTLEEPPAGYHFLLLSESRFALLPTIISRCLITQFGSERNDDAGLMFFVDRVISAEFDLQGAFQNVASLQLDETTTRIVIDRMLERLIEQYHDAVSSNDKAQERHVQQMIELVQQSYEQLPMPGSTNIFWRTLLLKILQMKRA